MFYRLISCHIFLFDNTNLLGLIYNLKVFLLIVVALKNSLNENEGKIQNKIYLKIYIAFKIAYCINIFP